MVSAKKKRVEPVSLDQSNSILFHPDGSVDEEVLEDLLWEINSLKLPKSSYVYTACEKRVSGFNPCEPEWEQVTRRKRVGDLYLLYKEVTGRKYTPKTLEESDDEMMMKLRRGQSIGFISSSEL